MDTQRPSEELVGLRQYLARIEAGELRLSQRQVDVSRDEIAVLKLEIAFLEKVIVRNSTLLTAATSPTCAGKACVT
jgi:hypothetical protein